MARALVSRGVVVGVVVLVVLGIATSSVAEDLGVVRVQSLNKVFDGIEAVAQATGQDVDRQMLMGMSFGMLGIEPSEFLDMDRPVAVALPAEGMMLQQNGLVAAVPVTDAAAAIEALAALFPTHTTEGELHTFATEQGPVLFAMEIDGYIRIGGSSDLVTGIDPLAGKKPTSALSLEVFLEPVLPMIEMGLQGVKEKATTELQAMSTDEQEIPYDPEAIDQMVDSYVDGVQSILADTSSIRISLDVEGGYLRFTKSLIPKQGSSLAGYIAAQKGGLPEIAHLADSDAAIYMAGNLTLTDEMRQGVKAFAESYVNIMPTMFRAQSDASTAGEAEAGAGEESPPVNPAFWDEYLVVMGPFIDRWVDCLRGDVVMSFDMAEGGPFWFTEAFGMNAGEACRTLVTEMGEQLSQAIEGSDQLAAVYSVSEGPRLGDSESLLMTIDMVGMIEAMGQPIEPQADALMKAMYGEEMTAAMVTVGSYTLATGGEDAADRLRGMAADLDGEGSAPSFAPLSDGPGLSMVVNLGRIMDGIKGVVPEGEIDLEGPADALNGEAGRIPMGIRFDSESASFELAVSLKTIETITAIVEEEKAKKANADAAPETTDEESN